jgi:branched-chain amino acid aminotransferase
MNEAAFVWVDGELVPWPEARIHFLAHGVNHGTGVFEGIRCYAGDSGSMIFRLGDHLARLARSARTIGMELGWTLRELEHAVQTVLVENHQSWAYIRIVAMRGYGEMFINPDSSPVTVMIASWLQPPSFPRDRHPTGIRATISSWRRSDPNAIPPTAKIVGGYVNVAMARAEAARAGFDEAVMLGPNGAVAEGTIENLFVAQDGTLITPPSSDGALPGITRASVMTIATDLGLRCTEHTLTRAELYGADEVFLTGTGAEVVPVGEVDGRRYDAPGELTNLIATRYSAAVRGEIAEYESWLTRIVHDGAPSRMR